MPNITRARTGELLRTLFGILQKHPEGMRAMEALAALRDSVKLTDYEKGTFESGGLRIDKILRWATVDCVKAGWLVKDDGNWFVTPEGIAALKQYPDNAGLYIEAVSRYKKWKDSQPKDEDLDDDVIEGETDSGQAAAVTYEAAAEQAWSTIEKHLMAMPPYEFQDLVGALLRAMGYHVGWTAPPGKDGGVDIVAFNDPLGTSAPRIKVQVKRQQSRVDVSGLRSFMAVLGAEDVGIFVNAGGFTSDADAEARTQATRRVTLLDLKKLVGLWQEHYTKLEQSSRGMLPLQPIYFLAPEA